MLELFDEMDGRLKGILLRFPDSYEIIRPIQKHVQHALINPSVNYEKYLNQTRGRCMAAAVNYPELEDRLLAIVEKIDQELNHLS